MEGGQTITLTALSITFLVGLSRAMILFIVTSGLSFVLGVLRVHNVAHAPRFVWAAFGGYKPTQSTEPGYWGAVLLSLIRPVV